MTDAERLQRLEERYAHLQRHMTEQDKAMLELADELARLKQELRQLRDRPTGGAPTETESTDERPPHY